MAMTDPTFRIRFHHMTIDHKKFLVAKLRRVSSSPVQIGAVRNPMESAMGRLADIIRLGTKSRNYADLQRIDSFLREDFHTTAEIEWAAYYQVICHKLGVERLDPFGPRIPKWSR